MSLFAAGDIEAFGIGKRGRIGVTVRKADCQRYEYWLNLVSALRPYPPA